VVNHPPRRQPGGATLGAYRESEVLWYVKHHGAPEPRPALLAPDCALYRLGVIRGTPKSFDSILALASLGAELAVVVSHLGRWERAAVFFSAGSVVKTVTLAPDWPESWRQVYAFDRVEIYGDASNPGHTRAYRKPRPSPDRDGRVCVAA